jgi:hypothetical protein
LVEPPDLLDDELEDFEDDEALVDLDEPDDACELDVRVE